MSDLIQSLLDGRGDADALASLLRDGTEVTAELPTPKSEEWRFSAPKRLTNMTFGAAAAAASLSAKDIDAIAPPETRGARLVFVNGQFDAELSETSALPEGVGAGLSDSLDDAALGAVKDGLGSVASYYDDAFMQLNKACASQVACLVVPRNVVVETPVHVLYLSHGGQDWATHPRTIVVAGPNSKVQIVEDYRGKEASGYFNNAVTEVIVGDNARVDHVRLQREGEGAFNLLRATAKLGRDAHYDSVTATVDGDWNRVDLYAQNDGENTFCRIDGLAMVDGDRLADTHSVLDNTRPHCDSHQLHKCIVDGNGRAVFNGKIFVRQYAQKVDAYQLNRNLLLSPKARVDTKPQLEIFADDVKCSHGATIGQLDNAQLFYLQSRGFTPAQAKGLLTYAFAAEVIDAIHIPSVVEELEQEASRRTRTAG